MPGRCRGGSPTCPRKGAPPRRHPIQREPCTSSPRRTTSSGTAGFDGHTALSAIGRHTSSPAPRGASHSHADLDTCRQHARLVDRPLAGKDNLEAYLDLTGVAGGDPQDKVVGAGCEDVEGFVRRELDDDAERSAASAIIADAPAVLGARDPSTRGPQCREPASTSSGSWTGRQASR
jgi:hypothetical protein